MDRAIYSAMANTSAASKGDFFKKGSGQAVILECLKKSSEQHGDIFIARFKILSSKGKDGSTPNAPGDAVGWPQMLTKYKKIAYANVKAFLLNAVGVKESETTADQFIALYEDAINYVAGTESEYNKRKIETVQDLRGMLVNFDTYDQQTKEQKAAKSTETNTYVKFTHVPDQGDLMARRAELDKTDPCQG